MVESVNHPAPDQLLKSLAKELKNPLTLIARQAELEAMQSDEKAFDSIRQAAEHSLKLVDSYLVMAQSEYGQVQLPLENIGVGSLIYDVVQEINPYAKQHKILIESDVQEHLVMTHSLGLRTALWCLFKFVFDSSAASEKDHGHSRVLIRAKKHGKEQVNVSIMGNVNISASDLTLARKMQGKSHLALSVHSQTSGVQMAIADILASSIGGGLGVAKSGQLRGLSLSLPKSQQLQLV